jgi:hypothetical protein
VLTVSTARAAATCGTGNPLSYDDVSAVLVQQDGCGVGRSPTAADRFFCSAFWTLFANDAAVESGPKPPGEVVYTQYNLRDAVGTYRLTATLDQARAILKKRDFFDLSPADMGPNTSVVTITVKRCAVVTRVRASLVTETESRMAGLLIDIMSLIEASGKAKISEKPADFDYDIFWDR